MGRGQLTVKPSQPSASRAERGGEEPARQEPKPAPACQGANPRRERETLNPPSVALFILLVLIAIPSLYDDRMSRTHLGVAKNVCQPAPGPQNVCFFLLL